MYLTEANLPAISPKRPTPSKIRNRGSSELVEFCADARSQQFVRQEAAQDPCGHDKLPGAPLLSQNLSSGSIQLASTAASSVLLLGCPSPAEIDAYAAVGSGSSSGASSYQGDSQPGSAASHDLQYHTEGRGSQKSLELDDSPLTAAVTTACFGALLVKSRTFEDNHSAAVDSLGRCRSAAGHAIFPASAAGSGDFSTKHSRESSAPAELEPPDSFIGARHSSINEVDFVTPVSLSLTPIRTRTNEAQEGAEPTPVVYVDYLAEPPRESSFPKVLPSLRPTINITATSTSASMAAPGAYNPYDRLTMGGGYQGGSQPYLGYGGGPPTQAASSAKSWIRAQPGEGGADSRCPPFHPSSLSKGITSLEAVSGGGGQHKQQEFNARENMHENLHQRDDEELDFIVRVPGGIAPKKSPPQLDQRDVVEHVVMVPGTKRRPVVAASAAANFNKIAAGMAACYSAKDLGEQQRSSSIPDTLEQPAVGLHTVPHTATQEVNQWIAASAKDNLSKAFKLLLLAGAAVAAIA